MPATEPATESNSQSLTITAADGGSFSAHVTRPQSGSGPAVLVLQEIFGVNVYIRDVCRRLAAEGYVAVAPDMFWRIEPGVDLSTFDQKDLETGMGIAGQFDPATGIADLSAALDAARALSSNGKVGVVGFCFGGTFAFLAAANLEPDVAVSYYGSGVAGSIDQLANVTCPLQFHFGGSDPYIPSADMNTIAAAIAGKPNVELHVQSSGGHAFDNSYSAMFSHPDSAASAWVLTKGFLAKHLA